jgi:hypothetical protein
MTTPISELVKLYQATFEKLEADHIKDPTLYTSKQLLDWFILTENIHRHINKCMNENKDYILKLFGKCYMLYDKIYSKIQWGEIDFDLFNSHQQNSYVLNMFADYYKVISQRMQAFNSDAFLQAQHTKIMTQSKFYRSLSNNESASWTKYCFDKSDIISLEKSASEYNPFAIIECISLNKDKEKWNNFIMNYWFDVPAIMEYYNKKLIN